MLIVVLVFAALMGTAFAALLLAPGWGHMKRSLWEGFNGRSPPPSARPRTRGQIAFDVVVVSGCISLLLGIACLAVLPIRNTATLLFLAWAAVGFATWAELGKRF